MTSQATTPTMNGQEAWTSGNELRYIIGASEHSPAAIYDSSGQIKRTGTYAEMVMWLRASACRPC